MFDIGWSEILVIAVVMIVVVGPKDLPKMLRTIGKMSSKVRGMAGDFQRQFNEALKEAELDDIKKSVDELRGLNPASQIRKHIDPFQQAAADVRAGLDSAMKPKPAEPPATPVPDVHEAEPLKNGAAGNPTVSLGLDTTSSTVAVGAAMTGTSGPGSSATVQIISPDAPAIVPPIGGPPVEIVSPDAPKPKRRRSSAKVVETTPLAAAPERAAPSPKSAETKPASPRKSRKKPDSAA